jgi:hypothetical protein
MIRAQRMDEIDVTPIKILHKRIHVTDGTSRHECWSLVEIDGARRVLYEAYNDQQATYAHNLSRRLMTVQEALREPRPVARMIWLALED